MKKVKFSHRMGAKILAFTLLFLSVIAFIGSLVGLSLCYDLGAFSPDFRQSSDYYTSNTCRNQVQQVFWDLSWEYERYGAEGMQRFIDISYGDAYSNAVIRVYYEQSGNFLAGNYLGKTVKVHPDSEREILNNGLRYYIAVAYPMQATHDSFWWDMEHYTLALQWVDPLLIIGCSALPLFFICLVFVFCSVGHRAGVEGIHLTVVDKVPLDLLAVICLCIAALGHSIWTTIFGWGWSEPFITLLLCSILALWFLLSVATRCKAGIPFKNTVIVWLWKLLGRILRTVSRVLKAFYPALPMIWKAILVIAAAAFAELLVLIWAIDGPGFFVLLFILYNLFLLCCVFFGVWQLAMLKKAGKELASGNFEHKINTGRMYWEFRQHGENLNSIGLGMANALDQRMRSERLKTELITNVSHDIKTPLTSIINYVDLLQREDLTEEERKEYLEVLARKSARLKKLTEDLVEASKASTGNMAVTLTPTSIRELLDQAVAEYAERLAAGRLEPVIHMPQKDLTVMADGRLLWRVMDNLLNNVCKYALPGTRVYLDARRQGNFAVISVKNVSRDPLNMTEEELMERFVRGDTARSTEGSGLGLNIARSLTELQHGAFTLTIDGDLFKAELSLRCE